MIVDLLRRWSAVASYSTRSGSIRCSYCCIVGTALGMIDSTAADTAAGTAADMVAGTTVDVIFGP